MRVRGAPAIAIVAALALAVELRSREFSSVEELKTFVERSLTHLCTSRPTAVNLFEVAGRLETLTRRQVASGADVPRIKEALLAEIEGMMDADVADNRAIGMYGAAAILKDLPRDAKVRVLTHCNAGRFASGA